MQSKRLRFLLKFKQKWPLWWNMETNPFHRLHSYTSWYAQMIMRIFFSTSFPLWKAYSSEKTSVFCENVVKMFSFTFLFFAWTLNTRFQKEWNEVHNRKIAFHLAFTENWVLIRQCLHSRLLRRSLKNSYCYHSSRWPSFLPFLANPSNKQKRKHF